MKIIDITAELCENCEIYEGDPHFEKLEVFSVESDGFALSKISMGTHTGTHTDAPSHFLEDGKSLAEIPLKRYIGRCEVLFAENMEKIDGASRLIIKSTAKKNGRLLLEEAKRLIEKGVKLIGTDALSIGGDEVHKFLLENECIIIEKLQLRRVKEGKYTLFAMPLKIDADGAPLRACLVEAEA